LPTSTIVTGKVKWFDAQKGYGFIKRDGAERGDPDIFVHYTAIKAQGYRTLEDGAEVKFWIEETPKGPQARDVLVLKPAADTADGERADDKEGDEEFDDGGADWDGGAIDEIRQRATGSARG